jgi:hypothetical protein
MWWTSNVTEYFYNNAIILPNTLRNDTDLVYNFYKIDTVVEESENKEINRYYKVGPNASKAIWTTFNSLKVMWR